MNKLEMAIQFIFDANKTGLIQDVPFYFDLAERIEEEALKRNYIQKTFCDKCKTKITHIEMSGQSRVKCDCKDGVGKNYDEAYKDWSK